MTVTRLFAVVARRYGVRGDHQWTADEIAAMYDSDECLIESVEGQPVDEWLDQRARMRKL